MNYDLISFDLDGTLVDTAGEIAEAANQAIEAHGIGRRPVEQIVMLVGAGTRELMRRLLEQCFAEQPGLSHSVRPDAVMASFNHHYAAISGSVAQPYGGCRETLARLRAAGLRLACVTNKEFGHAGAVLRATGLEACFDLVIGGDSLPEKKPHASVLQHAAATLGTTTARTAHVGDSAIDVQAARNAGVAAWAVPYGYNAGIPVQDANPERIFETLPQMADYVLAGLP